MQLGNGDFVAEEGAAALARARAHMTMGAVMKSPLVLSTNISARGSETLRVALNPLALRVNQDRLAAQHGEQFAPPELLKKHADEGKPFHA